MGGGQAGRPVWQSRLAFGVVVVVVVGFESCLGDRTRKGWQERVMRQMGGERPYTGGEDSAGWRVVRYSLGDRKGERP